MRENRRFLTSFTLSWPTDWTAVFERARPLIVEIGFGNADYLIALGQHNPDHNVIGLEISHQSIAKAEKKIARHDLAHVRAIHARAETALHHLFTPASIAQIHINYPDPWFKKRHSGRRLMQRDTLDAIVSRLQVDGRLYLATDIADYAEMSDALLRATPQLDNLLGEPWVYDLPGRLITTKYEAKGFREGRRGHYFAYRRNAQPAPEVPVLRELPMPHAIIHTPQAPADIAAAFRERVSFATGDAIYVALLHTFVNHNGRSVLFEVHIEEPTIDQHIALLLAPRDEAQMYTLKYATIGHPRATLGMHRAVGAIADWVARQHPQAAVADRRYRLG